MLLPTETHTQSCHKRRHLVVFAVRNVAESLFGLLHTQKGSNRRPSGGTNCKIERMFMMKVDVTGNGQSRYCQINQMSFEHILTYTVSLLFFSDNLFDLQ